MASKVRVGMIGITPNRGFSSIAHMPALQALPEFEVVAVCTTRRESADAAARHYGVPLAFADAAKLAQHPDVDLVTVCVKVPDHYDAVMAAIEAHKHVYCEWPLGRDTQEAVRLLQAAEQGGVRHAVGLQGRVSPSINYVRDLIAEGYVGQPLSATLFVNAANWGATLDRAYQASFANGANLMTITGGHNLDALCYCLGEFREMSAFAVSQRDHIPLEGTGELVPKDVTGPVGREWHPRQRSGCFRPGSRRHDPRQRIPVRDPRVGWRSGAGSDHPRLDAASRTDRAGSEGQRCRPRRHAGAGQASLGPCRCSIRVALQHRATLFEIRRGDPERDADASWV